MTREDKVFGMLIEANPIPEINDLELNEVGGSRYLAHLEQRSSEMTRTETRSEGPAIKPRRRVLVGVAAAIAVVLAVTAALLLPRDGTEPVATTTTVSTLSGPVDLQGRGNRDSHSFQLDAGSYSVTTTVTGECSYVFYLSSPATGHWVRTITTMNQPGSTTVLLEDLDADSYYISIDTESEFSCPWSMEIARP